MKSLLKLPEQECVGEWCPVFPNLRRQSRECVGRFEPVKTVPVSPEVFPHLMRISKEAEAGGVMIMVRDSFLPKFDKQ